MRASRLPIERRRGTSLVEIVLATMLTGVVIVGALNVLGGAIKTQTTANTLVDGPRLANELLTEIMAKPYEDPQISADYGLEEGEVAVRSTFDDIDDYDNWGESPPKYPDGTVMTDYDGWYREVTVDFARRDTGGLYYLGDVGLKRIHVWVTAPDGAVTRRYGYRWKAGALERPPAIDTEVVSWISAELQIGAMNTARAATALLNAPEKIDD